MSAGATLETTEMIPWPPRHSSGKVKKSSPDTTMKSGPQTVMMSCICCREPAASLTPTMFLHSFASRAMVAGSMFTPVRLGMLYMMMGMGTLSAMHL